MGRLVATALKALGVLVLAVIVAVAAGIGWLYATGPEPRDVPGWTLAPPLPSPRGELASAVAHAAPCPEPPCPQAERLFVIGGLSGLMSVEAAVTAFDPNSGEWRSGPPLPAARHHLGAAGLGEAVYAGGGAASASTPWQPTREVWRLDVGGDRWQPIEPMPEPRLGHRLVAHEGRLYAVGGKGPSARVLIYTPGEGWATGAEMPVQRDHLSVVVVDGRIWAIGGRAGGSLARVDIYDPAADAWAPGPELPAPTSGAAEGVVGDRILIFGGEEPTLTGSVYDRHWMLDTTATAPRWEPAPAPPLALHGADGAVFQGSMVIAGGAGRHGALSVTAWTDAVQRLETLNPAR